MPEPVAPNADTAGVIQQATSRSSYDAFGSYLVHSIGMLSRIQTYSILGYGRNSRTTSLSLTNARRYGKHQLDRRSGHGSTYGMLSPTTSTIDTKMQTTQTSPQALPDRGSAGQSVRCNSNNNLRRIPSTLNGSRLVKRKGKRRHNRQNLSLPLEESMIKIRRRAKTEEKAVLCVHSEPPTRRKRCHVTFK